jgi:NAD(P)-dependent dehydrogenase (short-subunit alcohol dehydrogenase family)
VVKAALPHLRARGGGHILQISSYGGQTTNPDAATVGAMHAIRESDAVRAGDPVRAAEIIVAVAQRTQMPYHLPLRVVAVAAAAQDEDLLAEDRRWAALGRSADFGEPYPVGLPDE